MYIGIVKCYAEGGQLRPGMIVKGDCVNYSKNKDSAYIQDNYSVGDMMDELRLTGIRYSVHLDTVMFIDIGEHVPSEYLDKHKDIIKKFKSPQFIAVVSEDEHPLERGDIIRGSYPFKLFKNPTVNDDTATYILGSKDGKKSHRDNITEVYPRTIMPVDKGEPVPQPWYWDKEPFMGLHPKPRFMIPKPTMFDIYLDMVIALMISVSFVVILLRLLQII